MKPHAAFRSLLCLAALLLPGTGVAADSKEGEGQPERLIAVIHPINGSNVKGTVVFERTDDGVEIVAKVGGLFPKQRHGIHIHRFGDLGGKDGETLGGPFKPDAPADEPQADDGDGHAGKLGNLEADANGNATLERTVELVSLGSGPTGILGRSVVIHASEDTGEEEAVDLSERIGVGVIGIAYVGDPESAEGGSGEAGGDADAKEEQAQEGDE